LKEGYPKGDGTTTSLQMDYHTFYEEPVDWLDCAWGGPFDDEEEDDYIILLVQGPLNKDGVSLGFLVVPL
jgi:hypothetical protein